MVSEIRLLDFFTQHLKLPEEQAREAVRELKNVEAEMDAGHRETIDKKFEAQKNLFATKDDVFAVKEEIHRLEQKIGTLEVRFEQALNRMTIWVVGSIFAAAGIVIAAVKLL